MIQEFSLEMKKFVQDMMSDLHTIIPGVIDSFDADKCEAIASPLGKFKKPDGSMIDYPKIYGVPVMFLQSAGQAATIVSPVKKGDFCLLLFSEQSLDLWRTDATSKTNLRYDLTNAIALVGLFSKPNPIVKEAIKKDAVIIDRNGSRIILNPNNTIEIVGDTTIHGKLTVSDDVLFQKNLNVDGHSYINS